MANWLNCAGQCKRLSGRQTKCRYHVQSIVAYGFVSNVLHSIIGTLTLEANSDTCVTIVKKFKRDTYIYNNRNRKQFTREDNQAHRQTSELQISLMCYETVGGLEIFALALRALPLLSLSLSTSIATMSTRIYLLQYRLYRNGVVAPFVSKWNERRLRFQFAQLKLFSISLMEKTLKNKDQESNEMHGG